MRLREFEKGLYALGDYAFERNDYLVVAVHPYFCRSRFAVGYQRAKNAFFRARGTQPIMIMEEYDRFEKRLNEFCDDSRGNVANAFATKTHLSDPKLRDITMHPLFNFAAQFQPPVQIIGGRIWEDEEAEGPYLRGCLPIVVEEFIDAGFDTEVLDEVTFA